MSLEAHARGTFGRPREGRLTLLPIVLLSVCLFVACDRFPTSAASEPEAQVEAGADAAPTARQEPEQPPAREWALVIHGGFSTGSEQTDAGRLGRLRELADAGAQRLADGQAALQVVAELIAEMEEDPSFNAGVGSTFNRRGVHEMSAALMDGRTRAFGAVGGLRNLRSPIAAARGALENHQGGHLLGDPADALGRSLSLPRAPQDSFTTRERFSAWRSFRQESRRAERDGGRLLPPIDPVGAVALDSFGNLAAGASFGGYTDSEPEQPVALTTVGPGLYADNDGAAVIALGTEERLLSCHYPPIVAADSTRPGQPLARVLEAAVTRCGGGGPFALLAIDAGGTTAIIAPAQGTVLLSATREAELPTEP